MIFVFLFTFCFPIRIIVDRDNFQTLTDLSYSLPVFIVFYSPNCPHCTKMHPNWIKFMEIYKDDPDIVAAEINCIKYRKEANKLMKIRGYPTYALVRNGRGEDVEVKVSRTTKDFCEKAEEIKKLYPPNRNSNFVCHFHKSNDENVKYPFVTLLSSINTKNNVVKDSQSACDLLQNISNATKINIDNFLINQTDIHINSSDFNFSTNSIVISKAVISPTFSVDYLVDYDNPVSDTLVSDYLYNVESLSDFAQEYIKFRPFGSWTIQNDNEFVFKKSKRRLFLFVYETIEKGHSEEQLSNEIELKYKAVAIANSHHLIINKVSSKILNEKWKISIPHKNIQQNYFLDLIVSDPNKTHFSLISDINAKNITEVIFDVINGSYDSKSDIVLEPLRRVSEESRNGPSKKPKIVEIKKRKSAFGFFAIGYLVFTVIITVVMAVLLYINNSNSPPTDSGSLIEHQIDENVSDRESENGNILVIEPDDTQNDQESKEP